MRTGLPLQVCLRGTPQSLILPSVFEKTAACVRPGPCLWQCFTSSAPRPFRLAQLTLQDRFQVSWKFFLLKHLTGTPSLLVWGVLLSVPAFQGDFVFGTCDGAL